MGLIIKVFDSKGVISEIHSCSEGNLVKFHTNATLSKPFLVIHRGVMELEGKIIDLETVAYIYGKVEVLTSGGVLIETYNLPAKETL